jgi:hypothetical protein
MAEQNENLRISILSPIDTSTKESAGLKLLKRYGQNIHIQDIAPSIDMQNHVFGGRQKGITDNGAKAHK